MITYATMITVCALTCVDSLMQGCCAAARRVGDGSGTPVGDARRWEATALVVRRYSEDSVNAEVGDRCVSPGPRSDRTGRLCSVRASADSAGKLEAAFVNYFGAVLHYTLGRVANTSDAQDIAAATFVAAWRQVDRLPDEPGTKAHLLSLARRGVSNYWRGQVRLRKHLDFTVVLADKEICRLQNCEDVGSEREIIMSALERLRPAERSALRLVYWENVSRVEAAELLHCSVNAFELRLSRARKSLGCILRPRGKV